MCAVSYVGDYARERVPVDTWNLTNWQAYQELVRKAAEFDKLTNQPHCEDPAKKAWEKEVEDRLRKLEGNGS